MAEQQRDLRSLRDVLDRMAAAGEGERVSVGAMMDAVGQRSHGPLLLVPSLVVVSPVSGVPGVPTVAAVTIALIAFQMLLRRDSIWLPRFIRRRGVRRDRMRKAVRVLKPVVGVADALVRPRLTILTHQPFSNLVAASCILIAMMMPPLEVVPFANSMMAAAVVLFGLSLLAHDGLLALLAFTATGMALYAASGLLF